MPLAIANLAAPGVLQQTTMPSFFRVPKEKFRTSYYYY